MPEPTVSDVVDNADAHRFELTVDGHLAELVYRLEGERIVFEHTGVPEELGGRGIGGLLVQAGVDRVATEGLTLVPQCPFTRKWLEKHPDEAARISIESPS